MIPGYFHRAFGYCLAWIRLVLVFGSLACFVGLGLVLLNLKLAGKKFAFFMRTVWCKMALKMLGVRVHATGKIDLTPGTLYVGNHRSLIDPLVLFSYLTNGYVVGKIEVSKYPLVNTGARQSGVVYVDRNDANSRKSTRETIEELLKKKMSVLVFPEGTISIEKHTLMFRQGSFQAAASSQSPVVAFALEMGDPTRDFWYGDGLFDLYFQGFSKWRTDVYLHFFEPMKGSSGEELAQSIQDRVNEKLKEFQEHWKK